MMPELVPVENDPFGVSLTPVEGNPFSLQGNVDAAIQQQNALEAARRATAASIAGHYTLPGRLAAGVQTATPGVMTEEDAFRLNQLEDQARNWGPQQAVNTIGGGVPMSQVGSIGAAGGKGTAALLDIRPAKENLVDLIDANFAHGGRVIGDRTVPIESLQGGISQEVSNQKRVEKIVRSMNGPNGYVERPIVDDAGNVIEGQHRIDALRKIGAADVPVTVIKDLARGYDISAMKAAIAATGKLSSDHVNQLVRHALNAIHDEGSPALAIKNTSIGGQFEAPYQAALAAAEDAR